MVSCRLVSFHFDASMTSSSFRCLPTSLRICCTLYKEDTSTVDDVLPLVSHNNPALLLQLSVPAAHRFACELHQNEYCCCLVPILRRQFVSIRRQRVYTSLLDSTVTDAPHITFSFDNFLSLNVDENIKLVVHSSSSLLPSFLLQALTNQSNASFLPPMRVS